MLKESWILQKPLLITAIGFFILAIALGVLFLIDDTRILGINRWIKPIKFSISIGIYAATLAVFLAFLKGSELPKKIISQSVIFLMVAEIIIVIVQSARGVRSHFNIETPLDGSLFGLMGVLIAINTLLVLWLLFLYFRNGAGLPKPMAWAIRLGIIVFLLASIEGAYMSAAMRHSIGVADGGKGLPLVNWSTEGGDLRIAHFLGLHAIQAIPLFTYTIKKYGVKAQTALTFAFAVLYLGVVSLVFFQALAGQPLISSF